MEIRLCCLNTITLQPHCAILKGRNRKKMTHIETTSLFSGVFSVQERNFSYAKSYSNQFLDASSIVMGKLSQFMKMNKFLSIVNGKGSVCRPHLFTCGRTKIVLYSS